MLHTRIGQYGRTLALVITATALAACGARVVVPALGDAAVDAVTDGRNADGTAVSPGAAASGDAAQR